ncbi:unnamed protein product, partial [marine sediment metagenome]
MPMPTLPAESKLTRRTLLKASLASGALMKMVHAG